MNLTYTNENGYICYKIEGNKCYLSYIEIDTLRRHQGKGTALMTAFFKEIKECTEIYLEAYYNEEEYLESDMDLLKLINFYTTLGFEKDEIQWEDIKNGNGDRLFMRKVLGT